MFSPKLVAIGLVAPVLVAALTPVGASAASPAKSAIKGHDARSTAWRGRYDKRDSRLGLEALGVSGSYGYGDDYPSYGSRAYNHDERRSSVASRGALVEGRAAATDDEPSSYPAWGGRDSFASPGSTYGRQTPDYGPGVTFAAPVSPYRWAYSSGAFPGTEFMGGR